MKGADVMGKNKLLDRIAETGNCVEEYMQGNVRIRIFDSSYVGKNQKDINKILEKIAEIAWKATSGRES